MLSPGISKNGFPCCPSMQLDLALCKAGADLQPQTANLGTGVLASATVKDLTFGSGIEFEDRGTHVLKGETRMMARFRVIGTPQPLTAQAEIALLRAAQEGTANMRKHAQASEASLTLSYLDDRVILDVRDDGRGFDAASAEGNRAEVSGGLGLRGLKARLAVLGGGLEVESAPGEGTPVASPCWQGRSRPVSWGGCGRHTVSRSAPGSWRC
jgi:hypothetical protein